MLRDEVTVEVRDRNLARKGTITTKNLSLKATIRHLGVGEWELTLPRQHPMIDHLLTTGSGIIVSLRGSTLFSGVTTRPRRDTNLQNPDGTYTFKGVTDDVLLLDSLAFPSPAIADPGAQDASNDVQTGNAETLMRHYVSANICNGIAPVSRTEGFRQYLRLATSNENRGITLTKAPRFQNLMELLFEIGIGADLGFQVIQRDNDLVFEVLTLTDRSDLVRLDIKNGTITSEASEVSAPSITRAIVAGQGEGVGRLIIERTSASSAQSENDWGRVIEQFVDQRNAAELIELEQSGDEKLIAGQLATTAIKIVPSDDQTMIYGADWEVGDTIAVVIDGVEAKTTVTAMTMIVNDQVAAIGAAIGDITEFDADAALVKRVENVETRTANLERSEGGGSAETHIINGLNKGSLYGSMIPAGTVVMFAGSQGDVIDIRPAIADGTYPEHYLVGITAHDIGVDQFGAVVQLGVVDGIDTSMFTLGSILYADATVPGDLSTTQGAWGTAIAAVTRVHAQTGRILVRAIPGGSGGGTSVYDGDTAPTSGNYPFWFKSDTGELFYSYDDGTSVQWVSTTADATDIELTNRVTVVENDIVALESSVTNATNLTSGTVNQARFPAGTVIGFNHVRTDSRVEYVGQNNVITQLNLVITPKRSNSLLVVQWMVSGEAEYNAHWRIYRDGSLIQNSGYQGYNNTDGSVYSGFAMVPYDTNVDSTPFSQSVQYVMPALNTNATTLQIAYCSSEANSKRLWLNRPYNSWGQSAWEVGVSNGTIWEIAQ